MDIDREIQRVVDQYRAEGYVVTHADADHMNGFPTDLGGGIRAHRGSENVLIEVMRTRAELESDTKVLRRAEWVQSHSGWRYDLIILEGETPTQRIARKSVEPTEEDFIAGLDRVKIAREAGLKEMAIIYAWALLEAAMRGLRGDAELYGGSTPNELLQTLYGDGFLTRSEYDLAKTAWTIRTQAVHGFVTPEIDSKMIEDLMALAKKTKGITEDKTKPLVEASA